MFSTSTVFSDPASVFTQNSSARHLKTSQNEQLSLTGFSGFSSDLTHTQGPGSAHHWTGILGDILLPFKGDFLIGQHFQIITGAEVPSCKRETTKLQSVAAAESERKGK